MPKIRSSALATALAAANMYIGNACSSGEQQITEQMHIINVKFVNTGVRGWSKLSFILHCMHAWLTHHWLGSCDKHASPG
jgi:hypothetical protein